MPVKPPHVWLVDDDASIRWVLERALKQSGMLAKTFEHANAALEALRMEAPDVLITDIRMPGNSGLELLQEIHESRPKLPVIVMTAHSDLDSAVSAYRGGAFEYLPKPFDIDHALDLVRRARAAALGAHGSGAASARLLRGTPLAPRRMVPRPRPHRGHAARGGTSDRGWGDPAGSFPAGPRARLQAGRRRAVRGLRQGTEGGTGCPATSRPALPAPSSTST